MVSVGLINLWARQNTIISCVRTPGFPNVNHYETDDPDNEEEQIVPLQINNILNFRNKTESQSINLEIEWKTEHD